MPRVKPLIRPDPRKTAVLAEIGSIKAALNLSQGELARRAKIRPTTFSDRMKDIGSMRLSELWAIQDVARKEGVEL